MLVAILIYVILFALFGVPMLRMFDRAHGRRSYTSTRQRYL